MYGSVITARTLLMHRLINGVIGLSICPLGFVWIKRIDKMVKYQIELTPSESDILKQLLYSELQKYRDRQGHASSHGQEYISIADDDLQLVVHKIEFAILSSDG